MFDRAYFLNLLASFLRFALAAVGTWFVKNGIGSQGDWEHLIIGLSLFLINAGSILYAKYKNRLHFLAAMNAPPGTSEKTVKDNASELASREII